MAITMTKTIQLLITSIILLLTSNLYAATFSAQLDVNPVLLSDSFQLTYTAEGSIDDEPDFSPIATNFDILGTRQSSNMSMINGDFKRNKKWTLTLRAKHSGTFIIPAIAFGNEKAPEVEVLVKDIPVSSVTNPTQDFLVELEASKKTSFIQEQVLITARLLIAQNISSYQFSEPRIDDTDTIIHPIGKDKQYKTYRGTKPYIIIEKKFAIFPQHAGKLHIDPFVAEIGIIRQSSRGNLFDPFNQNTSSKRIQSNSVNLQIEAKPNSFKGANWIPTTSLKLIEDWPHNTAFNVGEPITRTITLMADGLSSVQLPELVQKTIDNLKQYPDKPVLQDSKTDKGISSIRKEKIALIPTQAGTYTLPAIDIPWWNTKTNKIAIAHISKREFTVLASTSTNTNQPPFTQNQNQKPFTTNPIVPDQKSPLAEKITATASTSNPIWLWLSILFLVLWVLTLLLLLRSKKSKSKRTDITRNHNQSIATRLKYLKAACAKNDSSEIKTALLEWANVVFVDEDINNLSDLADILGEPISKRILALNENLYSPAKTEWQCGELYKQCSNFKVKSNGNENMKNSAELESLTKT